jgi:segregation and condensation protein A
MNTSRAALFPTRAALGGIAIHLHPVYSRGAFRRAWRQGARVETSVFGNDNVAMTGEPLVVSLEGYEGPLDLLLALARTQKVDLKQISILALVEQYLAFVAELRTIRLEIAADYLVMAAWLAYLKSRLLLPEPPPDDEPSGEELAARLALQLQKLEAMREAGARLMARERLGRDVFQRGAPEGIEVVARPIYDLTLFQLLKAYADHKARTNAIAALEVRRPILHTIEDALRRLEAMLGSLPDWATLEAFLPAGLHDGFQRRAAVASTLVAGLEMARQGRLALKQAAPFAPIFIKGLPASE